MFANLRSIIQFIKLLLDAYNFIDGEISEARFNSKIKERKKLRDEYLTQERSSLERLKELKRLEK